MNNPQLAPEGEALLPCPFCGEGGSEVERCLDEASRRWLIQCGRCGASSGTHKWCADAVAAWNRRALGSTGAVAPERIRAKFAEIRQQLKINIEIIKRDHPDPKPAVLPHVVEIITGHVEDRLRELEAMISTNITAAPSGLTASVTEFDGLADPKPSTHPAPADTGQGGRVEAATHRHKKRGSEYVLFGFGRMQAENWEEREYAGTDEPSYGASVDMREVAIYRSVDDGSLWVRPREEFEDGRFDALNAGART